MKERKEKNKRQSYAAHAHTQNTQRKSFASTQNVLEQAPVFSKAAKFNPLSYLSVNFLLAVFLFAAFGGRPVNELKKL